MNINNEEHMKKAFHAIYKPVSASPEFKETLLKSLVDQVSGEARVSVSQLSVRPELWFALAGSVVLAVISYGIRMPI